ncbi:Dak1 domain-containing protein [Scheffersomyces coipomensis]|uniref:Dak1 domain-containing protein n=1 Tax=Scheffersomyces coipomensis TaxID=1788519 RepID=UPI00315D414A
MTLTKHWNYNEGEDLVLSNLKGLVHVNPSVRLIPSQKVVFNPHSDTSKKIAIISGGGAGHEPLHAGFVGDNLLDAAVSGTIFASPSTKQIMAALKVKADKDTGVIIVVKNYTGDIINFGLVSEKAKTEGYNVEMVIVSDDVAVGCEQNKMVGRRGIAGTALVHKVIGAAVNDSVKAYSVQDIRQLGENVNANLVTIAASLDRTSVPGKNEEIEYTKSNEAELGLGIHNEPGTRISPIPNIDDLVNRLFKLLVSPEDKDRHYVDFDLQNDDYILLINNIGGTSTLELNAIVEHVLSNLPFKKAPKRVLASDFVTSISSPGFSITLLNLTKMNYETEQILSYIDAPTNAPGWKPKSYDEQLWGRSEEFKYFESEKLQEVVRPTNVNLKIDHKSFEKALRGSLNNLLSQVSKIDHYDAIVGDGDCGDTLKAGATAILNHINKDNSCLQDVLDALWVITELVEDNMGGTSGGLYSIFLTALTQNLQKENELTVKTFADASRKAMYEGLFKYTKARVGGRTLVDVLQPFIDELYDTQDLKSALAKGKQGCEDTLKLSHAKFGRASYVNEDMFKLEGGIPDPGAVGLLAILQGFIENL